jgi:hypothetical protein
VSFVTDAAKRQKNGQTPRIEHPLRHRNLLNVNLQTRCALSVTELNFTDWLLKANP